METWPGFTGKEKMKRLGKILIFLCGLTLLGSVAAAGLIFYGFYHYGTGLPDYQQLKNYEPPVMTRVHASDGSLIAEYARQRRLFVPIQSIPEKVKQAFLSAEDKGFYSHIGIDFFGIARAVIINAKNLGAGRRLVGASTITQQVAKNMLLTNEVSYERKIKEAILALRIERTLSKNRILELYLNEIYLGQRAYGVAAAALFYYDKALDQLTTEEAAYLAALPKAPNNYNPFKYIDKAIARRNWVIGRMLEDGKINAAEAKRAQETKLRVKVGRDAAIVKVDWFVEEVRRQLYNIYGEEALYDGGLSVRTTMDTQMQLIGERVLREGLRAYDRRHGWRGPLSNIPIEGDWAARLATQEVPAGTGGWKMALVLDVNERFALMGFADNSKGEIWLKNMAWARPWLKGQKRGAKVRKPSDVLAAGDVVLVSRPGQPEQGTDSYMLEQIPDISGGLVAMDPHTGRVHAIVGGWSFDASEFNRAVQAKRQPGSAFKPFVYAAALDKGYSPVDKVMDGPFVLKQANGERWKPSNYSNKFYGPSTLRLGVEKSRNLMTVRLARSIGMDVVADYASRFGIHQDMQQTLANSLGAGETTLLDLTTAYGELVNGGKDIVPTLIDRIQNRRGVTVFKHDVRDCNGCLAVSYDNQDEPAIADIREQIIPPTTAYQVVSMLEGVVLRGTGRRVRAVGKPLAGKTGTTNRSNDAWFMGFSPDLAVGVYVGFDNPKTLGRRETGSSVAAPIFRDFMAAALKDKAGISFRIPEGIKLIRINSVTGEAARAGDKSVILEAFKATQLARRQRAVLDGSDASLAVRPSGRSNKATSSGTGGLY